MKEKNVYLSSKTIDIAENDLYLELTNRLCYYDDSNLNDVMLPYDGYEDSAKEFAETLINMPLQAKYRKINNKDDLGSHEMYKDEDGEIAFGTESIGVHTSVEIKEDTVTTVHDETKTLPCLFATARVWKRNKKMISAIKRLFNEGKLNSSWEIQSEEYIFKHGIKILTKYAFSSNCLLGSLVTPAYKGTSTALEMSSINEDELMIAEALSEDLLENSELSETSNKLNKEAVMNKENTTVSDVSEVENEIVESEEVKENASENKDDTVENSDKSETNDESQCKEDKTSEEDSNETDELKSEEDAETEESEQTSDVNVTEESEENKEVSALTQYDLNRKIWEECEKALDDWCYIFMMFPEEHIVWVKKDYTDELTYYVFTYEVNNDVVTVSEPKEGTLTISLSSLTKDMIEKSELDTLTEKINTLTDKVVSMTNDLTIKDGEIASKDKEIAELKVYEEKVKAQEEKEIAEKLENEKKELKKYALNSKMISSEELETSEFKEYINNLNKQAIRNIISDRVVAGQAPVTVSSIEVETSEKSENLVVTSNLNNDDTIKIDEFDLVHRFISGRKH